MSRPRAGRGAPAAGTPQRGAAPPRVALPAIAPSHPAALATVVLAAFCALVSVTYPIFDTDLWQHLAVGKAIWTLHRVPREQLWSWPTYGTPDVTSSYSWLFRALLWPVWSGFGIAGLFAWRWATTLVVFALLWRTARRMGGRGLAPLFVLTLAALAYRQRAQVRPETLAAVWMALTLWILETRRNGGRDHTAWLVVTLWLWVNTHVSFVFGFVLLAFHLVAEAVTPRAAKAPSPSRLRIAALVAAGLAFANPYGWRALWQPLDFLLHQRHEPIFREIGELKPIVWSANLSNGLPLLVLGWPQLVALRALRQRFDLVEAFACASFTVLLLSSQRFVGLYVLVAAPFVARGLAEALGAIRWPTAPAAPWRRAAIVAIAVLGLSAAEWRRPELAPGFGLDLRGVPVAAADAIQREGLRGRGFTPYAYGGYLLWRFWPDSTRLPFMDIHQSGTPEIRRLYHDAFASAGAWQTLDQRYRFDYVLLARVPLPGETLLDRMDADSTWALVFLDDAAALYVRRAGPFARVAARDAYRLLPAGPARLGLFAEASDRDPTLRGGLEHELARQAGESMYNASAYNLLGYLANGAGLEDEALADFRRAIGVNETLVPGAHAMIARILLRRDDARRALAEIAAERRVSGRSADLDALEARARDAAGRR